MRCKIGKAHKRPKFSKTKGKIVLPSKSAVYNSRKIKIYQRERISEKQETADLVTLTEWILNINFIFCAVK